MKISIRTKSIRDLQVGIGYLFIGIIGLILAYLSPFIVEYMPVCLFQKWTGIPCPSCGATHAGIYLSQFHILQSLNSNPLFFFLYIGLLAWGMNTVSGLLTHRVIHFELNQKEKKIRKIILLSAIPVNWVYLICVKLF